MSDQKPQQQERENEIVWANCTREGCDGNQAEKLPPRGQPAQATFVRFKCIECGHTWAVPLGAPIVTDL